LGAEAAAAELDVRRDALDCHWTVRIKDVLRPERFRSSFMIRTGTNRGKRRQFIFLAALRGIND